MPKLPDATNLSGVNIGAPRSLVDIPVPNISGAFNSVAQGVSDVGKAAYSIEEDRRERAKKQERFDTKMGLIKADEEVYNRTKDLDRLDPQYPEKVRAAKRDVYGSILSGVKDPETRMQFDLETEQDYIQSGIKADVEHKTARIEFGKTQVADYYDAITKKALSGEFTGDVRAEVEKLIRDNPDFDELTATELSQKYGNAADAVVVDIAYSNMATKGYTLRPDVNTAISAVEQSGAPSWMGPYLRRLAGVESAGGYKLSTSKSSAGGIYAFTDGTGRQYGLNSSADKNDASKATAAVIRFTLDNAKQLRSVLGREPTPGELYLAHQQGSEGVKKLLSNPDRLAASAVGLKAVENNLPDKLKGRAATMTSAEFMQYWDGKFTGDASGGTIDPNDTLSVIENMPEFQRLPASEQLKFKDTVTVNIEKLNKEAEKDEQLNTAREAANAAAAGVSSLADGYRWLDENIPDPETREKARTMFKTDFEANEKEREAQYETALDTVYANVAEAVNRGDIGAAFAAIPAEGIKRKDLDDLQKRIADGPIQIDDPRDLERINDLKYSQEPSDQLAFSKLELNRMRLSGATREKLFKEQQAVAKEMEQTGSAPSLVEPSKMLSDRLLEIGIDTSSKVTGTTLQANLKAERRIKTILDTNLRLATERAGRKLLPDEMQRVMDDTFLEFSRKTLKGGWIEDYEVIEQQGLPAIMAEFDSVEQRVNAERQEKNEPLLPAGALFQQGIEELTRDYADAKALVDREMRALMSRARSPQARMQGDLDAEYNMLRRQQMYLETFRIDAEQLYNWLATKFAPTKDNE